MWTTWNPWHGCQKISAGCANCYVYRIDAKHGKDASIPQKTQNFDLPIKRKRDGSYKIPPNSDVICCLSSDFFLDSADQWRVDAWRMIRERQDLNFLIITKRIDRFKVSLPKDWGMGYPNVAIACTCENQERANYRLPIFLAAPIMHKMIVCEPLLGNIEMQEFLKSGQIEELIAGGESGEEARECKFEWILNLRRQCQEEKVDFHFKQTGARFIKDGKLYRIPKYKQGVQAKKSGLDLKFTK